MPDAMLGAMPEQCLEQCTHERTDGLTENSSTYQPISPLSDARTRAAYTPGVISRAGVELLDRVKTKYPRRAGLIDGVEATTKEQP